MIDERKQRVLRAILNGRRFEQLDIDIEQIDKCPVLLVGNAATIEDVPLVDISGSRNPSQRKRARKGIRIRIIVADDVDLAVFSKEFV